MAETMVNLVIRSKLLIDGKGGAPVTQGLVAIAGKRLVYAGKAEEAPLFDPQVKTLDLPEACLLPGLIDMHVHPTYYWEEPDAGNYTYEPERTMVYSPASIALLAASRLTKALMAGVTTARDVGSAADIMFDVRRAAQKKAFPSPKLAVSGRLIVPTGGHCHFLPDFSNEADGPYGFRQAVREELRNGADFIKIANNGQDLTQEELDAAVDEAHRHGKKVACHTGRPPAQRMAIEARRGYLRARLADRRGDRPGGRAADHLGSDYQCVARILQEPGARPEMQRPGDRRAGGGRICPASRISGEETSVDCLRFESRSEDGGRHR